MVSIKFIFFFLLLIIKTLYLKEYEGESSSKGIKYRNKLNQQLTTDVFKQGDLAKVSLIFYIFIK